jgi:acyl dehydratase
MSQYEVGKSVTRTKTFSEDDVRAFAQISGDNNPVHLDAEYAANTMFERPIVHGMFSASIISALLANDFPGPGTIYLGQNLKFTKPVYYGDTLTATVTVTAFREDKGILNVDTVCTNQNGDVVIKGDATVKVPS